MGVPSPAHCEVPLRINTKLDPLLSIPSAVQAAHNTVLSTFKLFQVRGVFKFQPLCVYVHLDLLQKVCLN